MFKLKIFLFEISKKNMGHTPEYKTIQQSDLSALVLHASNNLINVGANNLTSVNLNNQTNSFVKESYSFEEKGNQQVLIINATIEKIYFQFAGEVIQPNSDRPPIQPFIPIQPNIFIRSM